MKWLRSVAYIAVLGIASHFIGEALPRRKFDANSFPYKGWRFEKNGKIYNRVGISKWKLIAPDMSAIDRRMKSKRPGEITPENVDSLIRETCVAELIHWVLIALSPGVYFLWMTPGGLILALADALIFNLPFIMIQRYNRPRLVMLQRRFFMKKQRTKERALILTCNTGEGHNSAARAIAEALEKRGVKADVVDVLSFAPERVNRFICGIHNFAYRYMPWLFKNGYSVAEKETGAGRTVKLPRRMFSKAALYDRIIENGYFATICVHVFAAKAMTGLRADYKGVDIPSYFVATDYTCSPGVGRTEMDGYFIPHASLEDEFAGHGVPREKLIPSGIPVSAKFSSLPAKDEARARLGLNTDANVALMMCGSMGCGPLEDAVRAFGRRENGPDARLVVICGTNGRVRERIDEMNEKNVRTEGFVNDMENYLAAADVVVTKPGGLTTTECAVAGKPLVLINAVAGCETYNMEFFTHNGMAVEAPEDGEALVAFVKELMKNGDELGRMAQKAAGVFPYSAAGRIAETVAA